MSASNPRSSARRGAGAAAAAASLLAATTAGLSSPASAAAPEAVPSASAHTFTNPICDGADPWVIFRNGSYYLMTTLGNHLAVRKSSTMEGLGAAPWVTIWSGGGPGFESFTRDIWAPELHFLNGKWYVYYVATDGPDPDRRLFVLESKTDDPQGAYTFKGKLVIPGSDDYAIDPTVYRRAKDGALFLLWSGREQATGGAQNIYIAPMSDPWTVSGPRIRLSTPEFAWETHGWKVNEGPEVLARGGKTFVVFSASGGTTPNYCLGLLENDGGDLLNAAAWKKTPHPVFARYSGPEGNVYTPGHCSFTKSPDGKQDWIVYHGKDNADGTWAGRTMRILRFTWTRAGIPDFGHPIPSGVPLERPSGEGTGNKN